MTLLRNILLVTLPSLITIFLILEFTFTFIVPAAQFPYYYYDPNDHILRFSTTEQRDGVYTIGTMAQQRARWRINNAGWNSAIDFKETKRKPRVAIIGDSYIEALQVNVEESLAGQLRRLVSQDPDADVDVYAFGISGAPLSQYLQMARYARTRFDPDIFVINVVHNDFDESLCSLKKQAGMLCFEDDGQDIREAPITPYQPNHVFRMVRQSSVARFIVVNLQIGSRLERLISSIRTSPEYNANIDVNKVRSHNSRIQKVTDYVLSTLKRENSGKPVVFMIDAPRRDIYAGTMSESNIRWLNELLKEKTAQFGFYFIDLTDEFTRVFKAEHVHLESKYDWHWNEKGHQAAANALHSKLRALQLVEHARGEHDRANLDLTEPLLEGHEKSKRLSASNQFLSASTDVDSVKPPNDIEPVSLRWLWWVDLRRSQSILDL